jgi:MinD-like ATPase involved in chromosome partitioning or flagellar assembly
MRILTFGSGEAGAGTSMIAANLGLALSRSGVDTCLVDLDLASGDLHLLIGTDRSRPCMNDVLRAGGPSLSEAARPVPGAPHLSLVAGVEESARPSSLTERDVDRLVQGLRGIRADLVLVDLPGGFAAPVLDLFLAGDRQILVAEPGHRGARQAARLLHLSRLRRSSRAQQRPSEQQAPRVYTSLEDLVEDMNALRDAERHDEEARDYQPHIVLNRCRTEPNVARERFLPVIAGELGEDLGIEVIAEIPEDPWVERSVEMAAPLVDVAPETQASAAIVELAAHLRGGLTTESPSPAGRPAGQDAADSL